MRLRLFLVAATLLMSAVPLHAQVLPPGVLGQSSDTSADASAAAASQASQADPSAADHVHSLMDNLDLDALLRENSTGRWLFLLGAIFVGVVAGRLAKWLLYRVGERMERAGWPVQSHLLIDAASPASLGLLTVGLHIGLAQIQMSDALRDFWGRSLVLLYTIAVFWYAFNLVSVVEVLLRRFTSRTNGTLDDQVVPLVRKTLRIFLVVLAGLFIVDAVFEKDIGAWLAGLGIAGLAVSLAAQDSLKNLFGSITIFMDRPFHVGQRIRFGSFDGIIEEIGFRSCKLRTLDGNLVTIPNSNIVNDPVENISERPNIRRILNITITYDTPPDKIRLALQILKDILAEPGIREPIHPTDGSDLFPRVIFNDLKSDSLNLFMIYWFVPASDWWGYQAHLEKVNLRVMEELGRAGIDFAFPTQTLHLAGDPKRKLSVEVAGLAGDRSVGSPRAS
jgi:MscS family membrane protein